MYVIVDTFFVLDFDRCLGSTDASFTLLEQSLGQLGDTTVAELRQARVVAERNGESFSAFAFLRQRETKIKLDAIVKNFEVAGLTDPDALLEPGAREFLAYLHAKEIPFGIMSFGDPYTQASKIVAAGLGDIPRLIVDHPYKAKDIATWYDKSANMFTIPTELQAGDNRYLSREVVLVDDKAAAFNGLPERARGYWIVPGGRPREFQRGVVPVSVVQLDRIDSIAAAEAKR